MPRFSLKTKATIFFPLGLTLGLAVLLLLVHTFLHNFIKSSISTQQYQTVSILAEDIDSSINERHKALISIANKISRQMVDDPKQALAYLKQQDVQLTLFDNGMFLFDRNGRIVAEFPLELTRAGMDFSYRDYLKQTIATRKPFISEPYVSSQKHHPAALMFTAPIFDSNGSMIAILGGSIDLSRSTFVEKLSKIKLTKGGYFYLINQERVLISHPDSSRIMKRDTPPGANRLLDRAIAGFEGTEETITSRGLHTLTSFKHLKTKNWIISANYPVVEAYAPIYRFNVVFYILLPLFLFGTFWLTRQSLNRFTDPIIRLTRHVGNLSLAHGEHRLFQSDGDNEIAVLGQTFNRMVQELDQQAVILSKREEKFRIFFEDSSDAIFIVSADGMIREANKEASRRYGFSHTELVGMPATELDTPEESIHVPERINRVMNHGTVTFETVHRRKHDQPLSVEISASIIDFEGEKAILSVARDISSRKLAEQLLQRQNEYLQALHETTLGLLCRHDMSGLLQAIVARAGKLVGTEHCFVYLVNSDNTALDMVIQSGIYDVLEHYPIVKGQGIAGRVWETGEAVHIDDYSCWEGRLPDPDRDALHAMAGVPLKVADQVIGVIGLAFIEVNRRFLQEEIDILEQFAELASLALENANLVDESRRELAERKNAEERLRKLSVAVEQNPASIVITDRSGNIEYVNPHFTRLTGYSSDEAIGQNPRILKSGETSSAEYEKLWQTILAGGEWRGEFHNRKKDGELYWEQAHISPIRDNSYSITHFIAIKEDITELKQMESQLRHSQKMEAIGQLAGGIAHDFNNILTAIIGYSSIIQFKLPENSPLRRSAGQIIETAERGASLTQGLLAFSRKQASNPVVVNLNEIISRVQQLLLRLISEDIHLELSLSTQQLPVMADSVQIEQVLMNLATNAHDVMPKGGAICIKTEAISIDSDFMIVRGFGQPGVYAMMTFSDNGLGMDSETAKHIFEPFYTTKDLGKGTGLGLSIVYGIIKKHNGYVTCHSTEGIGTIFQIYFPLLAEAPSIANEKPHSFGQYEQGQDVILLAEDNETARELAKEILQEFGYTVLEAADGQQALDLFKANDSIIDLVILDVIMPKLSGSDVYDAILEISPGMKVLFYSGYSEEAVISQDRLKRGMNYLAKPYSPKELLMKVREVLDNGN